MLQGDLASINGRDRTEAFNECMKKNFPGIKVFGEATDWTARRRRAEAADPARASTPTSRASTCRPAFASCAGTLQVLKQKGLLVPPTDPKHVFDRLQRRHPGGARRPSREGQIDATVSQPADLYAKYALYYAKAAIDGQDVPARPDRPRQHHHPGPRRPAGGPAAAPLVTKDGARTAERHVKFDDKSLWGNNASS